MNKKLKYNKIIALKLKEIHYIMQMIGRKEPWWDFNGIKRGKKKWGIISTWKEEPQAETTNKLIKLYHTQENKFK